MANILDPTTSVGAKVSASGALLVTPGGDGYPTYLTKFGGVRITAYAAGIYAWALRAPANRFVDIRQGRLRLAFDGTATAGATMVCEFVRFAGADPAGGTLLVPRPKITTEAAALTVAVREGAAAAGPTLAGATVDATASALATVALPLSVTGGWVDLQMDEWNGLLLAPGEGLALRCVTALPAGTTISGWVEFSERV